MDATPAHPSPAPPRRDLRSVGLVVGHGLLLLVLVWLMLGGTRRDLHVPVRFGVDSLAYLTQTKTTIEQGWWWTNPRLSAPSAFNALLFPSASTLDQALVWVVSLASDDIALVINVTWIILLAASGVTAAYAMRTCGTSADASLVGGTLFALAPYAIYRNLEHFMLVAWLVPFGAAAAVVIASGHIERHGPRRYWPLAAGCALLGANYVYNAFFACVLIAAAGLGAFIAGRRQSVGAAILCLGLIGGTTVLNLAPSLDAWGVDGKPVTIEEKVPAEAEVYGLKIRHLVAPLWGQTLPPLAAWNRLDAWANFPLETENSGSRLGLIAVVGFLAGLAVVFAVPRSLPTERRATAEAAGRMMVAALLVATIGGFGVLFNMFVAPDIRGYSRIVSYLTFLSLLVLGLGIDAASTRRWVRGTLLAVVLVIGLWDQHFPFVTLNQAQTATTEEYTRLAGLVGRVEADLPRGALVLQLPFTYYLNDPGHVRMPTYDQLKPYVASSHLHWSYPAISNEQFRWEQAAMRVPVPELPAVMVHEGFSAIWVDTWGYADGGAAVLEALQTVPGNVRRWEDTRHVVFDIRRIPASTEGIDTSARPLTAGLPACTTQAPQISLEYVGGVAGPYTGTTVVRSGRDLRLKGWLAFVNPPSAASSMDVTIDGTVIHGYYGFPRPGVEQALGPGTRNSGFVAVIPGSALSPGAHAFTLRAASADGTCVAETPPYKIRGR
ncbi:MAG: hypothetical protein R2712_18885 [Vicinamibacterales bacterium]